MNLFELFCKIFIDDEDYQKGLDDAKKQTKSFAKDAGETIQDFAKKAEKALSNATKIASAMVGAASTGVGFLVKAAVAEFANYEQLVGGVETLFKESADVVQRYADNAYKTAGLSANDYMETVTSFSASLLQSLGGDTAEAADKANLAITDMSDNANKMGTDMSLIQNAYRGFAKANYTMLDNLALGYGGTKEEMQRLLDDANVLNRAQGKNTEYTIESFADIVDAIHDVQTQLGITGTTAKEAGTTIQGSVNAAKGAWHNLLIGVADDNQDFDKLVDNFVESVDTAADNILPRVEKSLDGILKLVNKAGKTILPRVIAEISAKLPDLIDTGAEIVLALGEGIVDNLDGILSAAEKVITRVVPKLAKGFAAAVPKIAQSCGKIIKELDGVAEMVGGVILTFKSLISGNWIGAGIGLLVTIIGEARRETAAAQKAAAGLTKEEWALIEAGETAASVLSDATRARDDGIKSIERETEKTQDLWAELQTLVDENGNVLEGQEERADYVLGGLNEALGTEYTRNGEIIEQYQTMQKEIDNLIAKRRAERLLANAEDSYETALSNNTQYQAAANEEYRAVENAKAELSRYDALVTERILALDNLERATTQEEAAYWRGKAESFYDKRDSLFEEWDEKGFSYEDLTESIKKHQAKYEEAITAANEATRIITNYDNAIAAVAAGRYDEANKLLTEGSSYSWKYLAETKKVSEKELQELQTEIGKQKSALENYKREYEAVTAGYTAEALAKAQQSYNELLDIWKKATGDAYDSGTAIALGLRNGFSAKAGEIISVVGYTVDEMVRGMNKRANPIASAPVISTDFGERTYGDSGGSSTSSSSSSSSGRAAESTEVTINVHADTDDLGTAIAAAVQQALDGVLAARGTTYRGGRTANAY